jgi:hypothetical protein
LKSALPKKVNAKPTTMAAIEIMRISVLFKCQSEGMQSSGLPVWLRALVQLRN